MSVKVKCQGHQIQCHFKCLSMSIVLSWYRSRFYWYWCKCSNVDRRIDGHYQCITILKQSGHKVTVFCFVKSNTDIQFSFTAIARTMNLNRGCLNVQNANSRVLLYTYTWCIQYKYTPTTRIHDVYNINIHRPHGYMMYTI